MATKQSPLQDQYNKFLNNILQVRLFESGKSLNELLASTFNVSIPNARQIVKRAVEARAVKSSAPYTFGNGQYIYLYAEQFLDIPRISRICQTARPPVHRLCEKLIQNRGIISYYEALKITAAPLEKSSTKVSSLEDIVTLLYKLDLVYQRRDANDVVYILMKSFGSEIEESKVIPMMEGQFSKMVTDSTLIPDILRWLGSSNLIDNSRPLYRNKKSPQNGAMHNNLMWDAIAYTRATGINPTLGAAADSVEKQTLVIFDICLSEEYNELDLDGFYSRIQINRCSVLESARKVLPIVIYRYCSDLALNRMRKLGFITFDIGYMFGSRIYDILVNTQELATSFKGIASINDSVSEILQMIEDAGQEDPLKDLRGSLFEFLMYPVLKNRYPDATIERGRTLSELNDEGKKIGYEYDYIIKSNNPQEFIFVELKGYHSNATIALGDEKTKSTLKWFFDNTLQFAIKYHKADMEKGLRAKAIYITTANFFEDGHEFLKWMNKGSLRSTEMNIGYDREALLELLERLGFKHEIKTIKKFYSKESAVLKL